MSKVRASFSRQPSVDGIRITGTLKRDNPAGAVSESVNQFNAEKLIEVIVAAIDGTEFDVETLDVTLG